MRAGASRRAVPIHTTRLLDAPPEQEGSYDVRPIEAPAYTPPAAMATAPPSYAAPPIVDVSDGPPAAPDAPSNLYASRLDRARCANRLRASSGHTRPAAAPAASLVPIVPEGELI